MLESDESLGTRALVTAIVQEMVDADMEPTVQAVRQELLDRHQRSGGTDLLAQVVKNGKADLKQRRAERATGDASPRRPPAILACVDALLLECRQTAKAEYSAIITEQENALQAANAELTLARDELERVKASLAACQQLLEQEIAKSMRLEADNQGCRHTLTLLNEQLASLDKRYARLDQEKREQDAAHLQKCVELQQKADARVLDVQQRCDERIKELDAALKDREAFWAQETDRQRDELRAAGQAQAAQFRKQLDQESLLRTEAEARSRTTRQELTTIRSERDTLTGQVVQLQQQVIRLENQVEQLPHLERQLVIWKQRARSNKG